MTTFRHRIDWTDTGLLALVVACVIAVPLTYVAEWQFRKMAELDAMAADIRHTFAKKHGEIAVLYAKEHDCGMAARWDAAVPCKPKD